MRTDSWSPPWAVRNTGLRRAVRGAKAGKPAEQVLWIKGFAARQGETTDSYMRRLIAHDRAHRWRSGFGGPD